MSGIVLLSIATPFVFLEIRGPLVPLRGSLPGTAFSSARLEIQSSQTEIDAKWTDLDGLRQDWSIGRHGPSFYEDTTYRIRAKSQVLRRVPVLSSRDPSLFQDVDSFQDDLTCVGAFNFRRQVGLSELRIQVGNDLLQVTIEVFPAKLDYAHDYRQLLSEVASGARGLALEYLRATYRSGSIDNTTNYGGPICQDSDRAKNKVQSPFLLDDRLSV